ncbi:MAG TPA: ThiF family adenylyltransferase [Thermoanaerobaculia bacterium]|jgi:adenylyltransferase/sulfurtransferase
MSDSERGRHSRSILFPGIGAAGQERIGRTALAFVGVGAVGAAAAEIAVRAGFGRVTVLDRDVVEASNLSRQFLFDAADAEAVRPKAEAAAARLSAIDPSASVRPIVADLEPGNAREILAGHELVFDGSDNFETRLLVSDASRALGLPSLYAACVGEEGRVALSIPGATPCLRCYLEALPPPGSGPTCDTAGVVPSLPPLVAAIGMGEVIRWAAGEAPTPGLLSLNVWTGGFRSRRLFEDARPSSACPVCSEGRFPALDAAAADTVKLCGRQSVQITPARRVRPDFEALERRLTRLGRVRRSPQLLNVDVDVDGEGLSLSIFSDGRCVVRGTDDPVRARVTYDRYVGS